MKKRKRLFGILLAVVMTVAMMTGCSAGKGGTSGSGVKVGFLAPTLQTEFMIGIDEKLHEECDNRGWDYVSASFDNDSAAAVSAIENMVTGNCNYIVAMVSDTSCDDALKAAQEKGVKIIECGVETAVHDLVLKTDQYSIGTQIGDMAADWLNSQLGGEGNIVVYTTYQNQDMQDRGQGIQDAIKEKAPNVNILEVVDIGKDVVGSGTTTTETSTETGTETSASAPTQILYGDANQDGRVDITDSVVLNKAAAGAVQLSDSARANADCNADGVLGSEDATILMQFLVKLIDQLPYTE